MADVQLRGVVKRFGNATVIHGVDLDIRDREFCVFVGPSGCGKSTLLRLVAGLEDITDGDLMIDGRRVNDLPPARRGIAMVFQSYALYPHMTTRENMEFGLQLAKTDRSTIRQLVDKAAAILQIEPLLDRKPRDMSGGQRQRVAIGRAIVRKPKVFLFDEPLSNLDAALRVQMRIEIARLHHELDATMIYVTHDQVEAMTLADKIVVLNAGRVEQVGSPLELYHHPQNLFVAGFIGSPKMNFLATRVTAVEAGRARVALPGGGSVAVPVRAEGLAADAAVTLGVRPEHLVAGPADGTVPARVFVVERLGGGTYVYARTEGEAMIVVEVDGDSPVQVGDRIDIGVPAEACHLFDADGNALPRIRRHPLAQPDRTHASTAP